MKKLSCLLGLHRYDPVYSICLDCHKQRNIDAIYAMSISRETIPYSNIEKTTLEIETGHLPIEFMRDVGRLIAKYEKKRLKKLK